MLAVLLLAGITGCKAQNAQNKNASDSLTIQDNKPKASWKVNRKFDDKGNLISYDSTYVWSYSGDNSSRNIEADSVMAAFKKQFDSGFPSFFRDEFGGPVWNDSLFYKDFTAPDYFMQKWHQHYFDMEKMMTQMDSMRNSFLTRRYPKLQPHAKD